ncbi:MAG: hypothetical protein GY816_00320, partial [Cytophagales bacterium]|nr:hypothetical protein [Cytophagales bacterium]
MKTKLMEFLEASSDEFKTVGGSRDVIYFGEFGYFYTGAYHAPRETPELIQELLDTIRPSLPDKTSWLNSCLITRYADGKSHI